MITIGIIAAGVVLLCAVTALVENATVIGHWLYWWIFDIGTAYYKYKALRQRRKAR